MSVQKAYETVQRMVQPGGCAWHEAQTHKSLTKYLIEETYELVDAIDGDRNANEMVSELADVLYQVLFHAAIAERDAEGYDLEAIAVELTNKLISRHPHVFGDRGYLSLEELEAEWEHLKEAAAGQKRGSRDALEGIPKALPSLAKAAKTVDRLQRAKLLQKTSTLTDEKVIGNKLLAIINEAVSNGIDPDMALRTATKNLIQQMEN